MFPDVEKMGFRTGPMGLVISVDVFLRHPVFPEAAAEGQRERENNNPEQEPEHEARQEFSF